MSIICFPLFIIMKFLVSNKGDDLVLVCERAALIMFLEESIIFSDLLMASFNFINYATITQPLLVRCNLL